MKWITRERVKVDRVACPWLIKHFVDKDAEFLFALWNQPEGPGLEAVVEGFRHLGFKDDHAVNAAEWIVYDALYAYCQEGVRQGKPDGMFRGA